MTSTPFDPRTGTAEHAPGSVAGARSSAAAEGGGSSTMDPERLLVAELLAGDRAAAAALYGMLQPVVDRTLRRILGRREADYEDLVQQSFEQIVRTLRERRFTHACPLTAWACTLTARVALTELRRRYRHRRHVDDAALDLEVAATTVRDWEHGSALNDRVEPVRRALGELEPGRGWVVVLHDLEGHRLADVATMLGISLTAAQSRLLRGRQELLRRCRALEAEPASEPRGEEPP